MAGIQKDYARKDHSKDEQKIEIFREERETGIIETVEERVCVLVLFLVSPPVRLCVPK